MAVSALKKPSLGAIFLTIFLYLLGFGLVLPFLAEEARDTFHTTAFLATLISAVYSLMGFFFMPVWGRVSDRIGRRPVLLWSIGATAASNLGLGLALAYGNHIGWLFAMRMFAGIATANISTASAYITDVTSEKDRAKGMGLIGMAFGLGFVLGPGVGGLLASIEVGGRHGPVACFVASGLSIANFVWAYFGLAESLPRDQRGQRARGFSPFDFSAAKKTFADPALGRAVIVNFVAVASFANLDQTYRFFNKDLFFMNERQTGVLLAVIGVAAASVQGGLVRKLSGRVADSAMLRAGIALQLVAFSMTALAPAVGKWLLFAGGVVLATGNGLSQPSISALVSKRASPSERGAILGTNQSAASLARVVGPAMGGWLYGSSLGKSSPYWAAATGMALALLVAMQVRDARSP